jgi:sugar O-acyltransferase (sialic acid O-acetyltransferase NeuD family)
VIIVGAGETAELAYDYFTHDSTFEVAAFSVERSYLTTSSLLGLPVVAFEDVAAVYEPSLYHAFVAVSQTQLNRVRTRLYLLARAKGYRLASYVSSKAFVGRNVAIGENCFILEHNVLQYGVTIGNNVVLWSGNHVGHRTVVRDHCFVSSHVVISGYCDIGESCFLGVNSCFRNHLTIERDCLIGMGAVVIANTQARKVYVGNPAKASIADSFSVFGVAE